MTGQATPESLFSYRVASDPSGPFVTFYDDATGERAELSAKSLGNWVAKTHFLLLDELGLSVGDSAFVSLPVHWLAAPIAFGCWFAGLTLVDDPASADVAFGTADLLAEAASLPTDVFAVSMLSMGRSDEPPAGMNDYAASVRPMPDAWATVNAQASPFEAAITGVPRSDVPPRATALAKSYELQPGGRLLWTRPWHGVADYLGTFVAPLAVGGSVVLVRHVDPASLERKAESERVTASVA